MSELITRELILLKILETKPATFQQLRSRFNAYEIPRIFSLVNFFDVRNLTTTLNKLIKMGLINSRPYKLTDAGHQICKQLPSLENYKNYPKIAQLENGGITNVRHF